MRQVPTGQKFSVAWFKLAEFVERGERERALGIYKLLVHAIEDKAFALQLEGDLLLAFKDERALHVYEQAAKLYSQAEQWIQAAAVYEHLILLRPNRVCYKEELIQVYMQLPAHQRAQEHQCALCKLLLSEHKVDHVLQVIAQAHQQGCPSEHIARMHHMVITYLLKKCSSNDPRIMNHVKHAIDLLIEAENSTLLQEILSDISVSNEQISLQAYSYLEQKKNID